MKLPRSAEFVVAHNAGFDRKVLERRLPQAAGLAWACSCAEVDWRAAGFEGGRSLGWLLVQIHRFHGAHRAGDDVDRRPGDQHPGQPCGRVRQVLRPASQQAKLEDPFEQRRRGWIGVRHRR